MRDRQRRTRVAGAAGSLLGLGLAVVATAGLPRLPADRALPRGPESPGVVVFSHASHVGSERPDCTTCHPKPFSLLKQGAPAEGGSQFTHEQMEAGRQCGACHDGKAARGFDDCAACHRDQ